MYDKEDIKEQNRMSVKLEYDLWYLLKQIQDRLRASKVNMTMSNIISALILQDPEVETTKIVLQQVDDELKKLLYPKETLRLGVGENL